jgi:hypothetical protein
VNPLCIQWFEARGLCTFISTADSLMTLSVIMTIHVMLQGCKRKFDVPAFVSRFPPASANAAIARKRLGL